MSASLGYCSEKFIVEELINFVLRKNNLDMLSDISVV